MREVSSVFCFGGNVILKIFNQMSDRKLRIIVSLYENLREMRYIQMEVKKYLKE
jgi:hypothetical protein